MMPRTSVKKASPFDRVPPLAWVLVYLIFGVLWILLSDTLLLLIAEDRAQLSSAQTIKGIVFVLLTAGLLYVIFRRGLSALRASETRLRSQSETLRSLIAASPVAVTAVDRSHGLFLWSPMAERMFGWSRDEVLGRPSPLLSPEDEPDVARLLQRAFEGHTIYGKESRVRRKDGSFVDVSVSMAPLQDDTGGVLGIEILYEDITARKRIEEALAEERAFTDSALSTLPDIFFVMSEAGELLRWNEPARAVTGYDDLEIATLDPRAFFAEHDAVRIGRAVEEVLDRGNASLEATIVTKDGRHIPYEFRVSVLRDADGDVLGICGIGRDVTERNMFEQELQARNRELEILYTAGEKFTRRLDLDALYEYIVEAVVLALPHADAAALWLCAHPEAPPRLAAWHRFDAASMQRLGDAGRQPLVDVTLASQTARRVVTPRQELDVVPLAEDGYRAAQSFLSVALVLDRTPIGVLAAASFSSDGAFEEREGRLLQSLASRAAIAIQNARLFENLRGMSVRLLEAQEAERRRIAQELHDEMGGLLTSLKMSLVMNLAEDAAPREGLEESIELVDTMMEQMRQVSLDLRPSMLDDLGLVPALEWFTGRFAARTKVRVDFRHDVPHGEHFAGETKTAAYRIVQESLTNVARYARVEDASVRVWRSDGWLYVEVSDEGIGFDLKEAISRDEKLGLAGMRERALLLGGDLSVTTAPGEGCRVMARLPLDEQVGSRARTPAIHT